MTANGVYNSSLLVRICWKRRLEQRCSRSEDGVVVERGPPLRPPRNRTRWPGLSCPGRRRCGSGVMEAQVVEVEYQLHLRGQLGVEARRELEQPQVDEARLPRSCCSAVTAARCSGRQARRRCRRDGGLAVPEAERTAGNPPGCRRWHRSPWRRHRPGRSRRTRK